MDVLTTPIVVIISQYLCVSGNHVAQLKCTQCYMSIISQWNRGEKRRNKVFFTVFFLLKIKPPRKTVNTVILLQNTEKKMTKFTLASRKDRLLSSAPTSGSCKLVIADSLVGVKSLMPLLPTTLAGKPGKVSGHCQGLGVAERKNTVMRFRNPKYMALGKPLNFSRSQKKAPLSFNLTNKHKRKLGSLETEDYLYFSQPWPFALPLGFWRLTEGRKKKIQ